MTDMSALLRGERPVARATEQRGPRRRVVGTPMMAAIVVLIGADGCGVDHEVGPRPDLLDPRECARCHPAHYQQWLGSMHAYAAEDPIFLAMNARGQRETGGTLGDFCVRCHAPVAVALGKTEDGLNLDDLDPSLKGVTCYFCHNVESIGGTHASPLPNNPLKLGLDAVMRGEFNDAIENDFHDSEYSPLLDDYTLAAGDMCGSCHDIVNGNGVHIERTHREWLDSFYDDPSPENPQLAIYYGNTCGRCHMYGAPTPMPIADYPGVRARVPRSHDMVGVDLALTDFPDSEVGPSLVARQTELMDAQRAPAVCAGLCVSDSDAGGQDVQVWLHNEAQGHAWPSGATQDRRAWLQLEAFAPEGGVVLRSGVVGDDESIDAAASLDPSLWVFRDVGRDADGAPTSMFWNIAAYDSNLLPIADMNGLRYDRSTWRDRTWHVDEVVERVSIQLNLRAIPFELVDELASEEMFDPDLIKARIRTNVAASTMIEWTADAAIPTDAEGPVEGAPCVWSASCFCALAYESGACP